MNINDKITEITSKAEVNASSESGSICSDIPAMPTNPQYVFAYIKFQQNPTYMPLDKALCAGTIFEELYLPC
jgi:hypothetical protein